MSIFKRYLGTVAVLWLIAGVGFFGMRFFGPLVVLGLPFSIPGFIVLGTDEVQERYGYWGEPFYFWLLALPCALVYAFVIQRLRRHENAASMRCSARPSRSGCNRTLFPESRHRSRSQRKPY